MRRSSHALALALALPLAAAGCSRPEYFEMQPTTIDLTHKGESATVRAVAKDSRGIVFPDAKPTRWKTSDEKVATVDGEGRVTAVGSGRATIEASRDALLGEVQVEVTLVERFEVEPAELSLVMDGEPVRPTVRVLDARGKPLERRLVTARCADEKLCTVDKENKVWPGAQPGETTAEFRCEGFSQTVKVKVAKGKR